MIQMRKKRVSCFLVLVSWRVSAQKLVNKNRGTRIWIHADNNLSLLSSGIHILSNNGSKFFEVHCFGYPWISSPDPLNEVLNKTEVRQSIFHSDLVHQWRSPNTSMCHPIFPIPPKMCPHFVSHHTWGWGSLWVLLQMTSTFSMMK